ncbi:MAG: hypothetical protein JSV78_07665 [Phycisphaerales bacterium]|nr:MAG: hypothetical protein JSV78_07665 [Phycisphaerales bacterium]
MTWNSICGHTLREEDVFGSDGGGLPGGRFCPADDCGELTVQPDSIYSGVTVVIPGPSTGALMITFPILFTLRRQRYRR